MFSIIVPLYNKSKYVKKAVISILKQTFQEFEVIIINDGSTDDSLDIVKSIDFSEFDVQIVDQKNSGVSTTRNNGVKLAKYDYVVFLDADDWWDIRFLEQIKNLIEEFPHAALYATSYYRVKKGKNISAKIGVAENFKKGYFDYIKAYSNSIWMPVTSITSAIRKDVFEQMNGFKTNLKYGEDCDLWLRIALKHKMVLLNQPFAYYNQDVEIKWKAVGTGRYYKKEEHMLFNFEYLANEEKKNPDLKLLLDNLRTYGLFRYYLNKDTREDARLELSKVDWTMQSKSVCKKYKQPIIYQQVKYSFIKFLLECKKVFIK